MSHGMQDSKPWGGNYSRRSNDPGRSGWYNLTSLSFEEMLCCGHRRQSLHHKLSTSDRATSHIMPCPCRYEGRLLATSNCKRAVASKTNPMAPLHHNCSPAVNAKKVSLREGRSMCYNDRSTRDGSMEKWVSVVVVLSYYYVIPPPPLLFFQLLHRRIC